MDFYEEASLVMVPSGYKDQKVYSSVPDDGSADLTFSRASSATRVNSSGLVEKVRTNLLLQSNSFDTTWTNNNSTETSGQAGYDGTNNAWFLTAAGTSSAFVEQNIVFTGLSNYSVYLKKGTSNFAVLTIEGTGGGFSYFDLNTGALGTASGVTASIQSVGNGWYRCSVSASPSAGSGVRVYVTDADNSTNVTNGNNILIQAAQYETGDIATDYIATTSAAVSVGPVSGLPRLNYDAVNPTSASLLLEPQRSNVILFSESIDNAAWGNGGVTITANQTTSPSGYVDADLMTEDTSTGEHVTNQSPTTTAASWAWSAFLKSNGKEWVYLRIADSGNNARYAYFNLVTGTVGTVAGQFTSATITDYGNGWYRCEAVIGTARAGNSLPRIGLADGDGVYSYTGDGTSGVYVWGAQLELGAYATSYIPTLSTAVTRVKDEAYKTGVSSLIGQTEGTLFADVNLDTRQHFTYFAIAPNVTSTSNYLGIYFSNTTIGFEVVVSAAVQAAINLSTSATGRFKIAAAYKANDFVLYINGAQVGTDTSGSVPACSQVGLYEYNQTQSLKYNQALLFTSRLSNADLATLTTL